MPGDRVHETTLPPTLCFKRDEGDSLEVVDMTEAREFWFSAGSDNEELSVYLTHEQGRRLAMFLLERANARL